MASFDISESEARRYDRQIRVWGAEAQSRIQSSTVLVCGLGNVNVEVVKNIVLAGMKVTIQDSSVATYDDLTFNFFLTAGDVGNKRIAAALPRIQELNNFAVIQGEEKPIDDLPDEFFSAFRVILMTECSESQALRINKLCRSNAPQSVCFWSDIMGEDGISYCDFGDAFQYKEDKPAIDARNVGSADSADGAIKLIASNDNNGNIICIDHNNNNSDSDKFFSLKKVYDSNHNSNVVTSVAPQIVQPIKTMQFPALSTVLGKQWNSIPSRFFPLSGIFVRNRLLTAFRTKNKRNPTADDISELRELLLSLQAANGIPVTANSGMLLGDDELNQLVVASSFASVLACSVLGSFISQEVVKAVSLSGTPAFNVLLMCGEDCEVKAVPIA